jgi:hypothetical protein
MDVSAEQMPNFLTVIHECKDYPTWKKAYDADAPNRAAAGLTDIHGLREHDNANLVALMFAVSDVGRAKAFATSPDLAATMKAAGIIGAPRLRFRHGEYNRVLSPAQQRSSIPPPWPHIWSRMPV